jgi:hypothetical protein
MLSIDLEDFHGADIQGGVEAEEDNYPIDTTSFIPKWTELRNMSALYDQAMNKNAAKKTKTFKDIGRGVISIMNGMLNDWGRLLEGYKNRGRGGQRDRRTYRIALNPHFAAICGSYTPRREPIRPERVADVIKTARMVHFRHANDNHVEVNDGRKRRKTAAVKKKK